MLNDWQLLGAIAVAYIVGRQILVVHPKQKREKERENNPIKVDRKVEFPKIEKPDFYGLKAEGENPDLFYRNVKQLQKKLEAGHEVSVDAVTAFYLMRNIQHHNLIVGETGTINMNFIGGQENVIIMDDEKIEYLTKQIMDFKSEDEDHFVGRKELPAYIRESIPLSCGGIKWVFHDWHAKECGMVGLCFDKFGRPMPDPDQLVEDKKAKEKKHNTVGQNKDTGTFVNLATQVSRISEIVSDMRGEQILKKDSEANGDLSTQRKINEVQMLEDKHPIPSFFEPEDDVVGDIDMQHEFFGFDAEKISNVEETVHVSDNFEHEHKGFHKNILDEVDVKDEYSENGISYFGYDEFLKEENLRSFQFEKLLENIFSSTGQGNIFADIKKREVLVEKNYLAIKIQQMIKNESQSHFKNDFLAPRALDIFDSNKINTLLHMIDGEKYIVRFGAQKKKLLQKILLSSLDKQDRYYVGLFVRLDFSAHKAIGHFLENYLGDDARVEVVADSPREIESRISKIKDLIETY